MFKFFSKLKEKVLGITYDWLPLSFIVFIVYMIQRGFAAISKAGYVDTDLKLGMGIFFTTVALSITAIGFLSDRVKAQYLILAATVLGTIGILGLGVTPWIFGIGMGMAAAVAKMIPFTAPLKNKTTNVDALRISPQAAAKNIGGSLFFFILAAVIKTAGFDSFTALIAPAFAAIGTWAYFSVKNHDVKLMKWNKDAVISTLKNKLWYVWGAWYVAASVAIYTMYPKLIPQMLSMGATKSEALYLFGTIGLCAAFFRWGFAWLGDLFGHFRMLLISLATMICTIILLPVTPYVAIPLFFLAKQINTPNMWATAKSWFTKENLGTAAGMAMIISYIIIGFMFGKW